MNGTDIETALDEFADACVRGGDLNLNHKHAALRSLIRENREAIPPQAAPDLSIPGLHLEVCVCVRCGRRRIEHFVESLAGRAEACDAYTLDPDKA